jgi:hypothetical protein
VCGFRDFLEHRPFNHRSLIGATSPGSRKLSFCPSVAREIRRHPSLEYLESGVVVQSVRYY